MTYSGSPNSYFKQLPNLDYPSLANDRNSAYDYQVVKNIFKRAVLRDDVFDEVTAFTKYSVVGNERPDQVAAKFYNDPALDWVILTTNNIVHLREEGPMGSQDFLTYLKNPDIFTLQYKSGKGENDVLNTVNRFNPGGLALTTMAVDYAPNGYWSAYKDSQPVAVKMDLSFTELRPIYEQDLLETPSSSVGY